MGDACSTCGAKEQYVPEPTEDIRDSSVFLHVYDLSTTNNIRRANRVLKMLGTGAFHAGVEVYGPEWSYGGSEEGTGVFNCAPRSIPVHHYRESVAMGSTPLSYEQVRSLVAKMSDEWQGPDYDLLRHNCCFFANDFCIRLKCGPIPKWILNLAGAGAALSDASHHVAALPGQLAHGAHAAIVSAAKAGHGAPSFVAHKGRDCMASGTNYMPCCGGRAKALPDDSARRLQTSPL